MFDCMSQTKVFLTRRDRSTDLKRVAEVKLSSRVQTRFTEYEFPRKKIALDMN